MFGEERLASTPTSRQASTTTATATTLRDFTSPDPIELLGGVNPSVDTFGSGRPRRAQT